MTAGRMTLNVPNDESNPRVVNFLDVHVLPRDEKGGRPFLFEATSAPGSVSNTYLEMAGHFTYHLLGFLDPDVVSNHVLKFKNKGRVRLYSKDLWFLLDETRKKFDDEQEIYWQKFFNHVRRWVS